MADPSSVDQAIAKVEEAIADRFTDVIPATTRGGYLIASASRPGLWWMVQVISERPESRIVCPCEHGQRIADGISEKPCRHMQRLLAFTKAEEARLRRPAAPANVSAMVD